jgi:hypothetical protein
MKKFLTPFALLFLGTVIANNYAKAQESPHSFCIHDEYGYVWSYTVTHIGDNYKGKGTVDVGAGFDWIATGTFNTSTGATTLTATNPQADGCNSGYVDYFTYSGTATADWSSYSGEGSWESFCSGSMINSGGWDGTDCAHKGGTIKPNGPAKHAGASLIKVSPNPVNSHANISYSVLQSGKVNITVYNSMQQAVKILVNDFKNAGNYTAVWDAKSSNVNAGTYRVVAVINGKTYATTVQVVR